MDIKLIRNRDYFDSLLEYDVTAGSLREVPASSVPKNEILPLANYIKLHDKYYGVFATESGPCFFFQSDKYLLNATNVAAEHTKGDVQHHFRLIYNGKTVIDLHYARWNNVDIDAWSDESFIDFFIWLTKSSVNQEFIQMWTLR